VSVCQGDVRNATIEGIELKCPVVVEQRALRPDSCGAGKFRGGLGIDMIVRNLVEGRWNFQGSLRRFSPPWGLAGGKQGGTHTFLLKEPDAAAWREMDAHRHPVPQDSRVVVRTGGGGGWGDPLDRDPERVRWDVIEGYVSREAARSDYGVVLDPKTLVVDAASTAALRRDRKGPPVP
jgi:N-methylhydantoinase B